MKNGFPKISLPGRPFHPNRLEWMWRRRSVWNGSEYEKQYKEGGIKDRLTDLYHDVMNPLDNVWIWINDLLAPHNRIDIKTLKRRYHDPDTVLLHASFQILTDFIENEIDHLDTEGSHNRDEWDRLFALYDWWKHEYRDPFEFKPDTFTGQKFVDGEDDPEEMTESALNRDWTPEYRKYLHDRNEEEARQYNEANAKLKELADLRMMLWS